MRVLYIHDRPSGGAGESLFAMAKGREGLGESFFLFGDTGFVREKFEKQFPSSRIKFVKTRSWLGTKWPRKQWLSILWRIAVLPFHIPFFFSVIKNVRSNQIDLIHTNCIFLIEGALAAKILGIPHVWHVRELVDLDYYQFAFSKRIIFRFINALSERIICNSYRTRQAVKKYGVEEEKIAVAWNTVNSDEAQRDAHKVLNIPADSLIVGVVGWITPNKRVEDFLAVSEKFANWSRSLKFVIIGGWGWDTSYNDMIQRSLEANENKENIIFTGILENAANLMGSLDVLMCPCYTESFGRTVAEALAVGTPVIGVRGTAVEEIIDDDVTGYLVEHGDVKAMELALRKLLENDELRASFGAEGVKIIKNRFNSDKTASGLDEIYRQAIKSINQNNLLGEQ